jgi:hypothetical protein
MVLFLRNDNNKTLFEVEVWANSNGERGDFVELSATVHILNYSNHLLNEVKNKKEFINTFEMLSELRGWLWERYFMVDDNDSSKIDDVVSKLRVALTKVASTYNLNLIDD